MRANFADQAQTKAHRKVAGGKDDGTRKLQNDTKQTALSKTLLLEFANKKLNFKDLLTIIEETRKKENEKFGMELVRTAQAFKDKRGEIKVKKNFLAEHNKELKNWSQSREEQQVKRRLEKEMNMLSAIQRKKKALEEHRKGAEAQLVKWDLYRIRRDAAT